MKKALGVAVIVATVLIAIGALVAVTGLYNVAADEPHTALVQRFLDTVRERSIAVRAADIEAPDLDDAASVRRGAGNYDSMCEGCHLAPGMADSELSMGLYPAPPNLTKAADVDPARTFWVIKHGVKASGMPAWGKHMEDEYIWDIVAFVRKLPALSAEQYAQQVAASGGHSHGGVETGQRSHQHEDEGAGSHEQGQETATDRLDAPSADEPEKQHVHTHPDGREHVHED
ncbi:MAG: c-type cytochrome [Steroidobacter sp.]